MGSLVRRLATRDRGYLLVLVAVCVSLLSISYLRLAANSAANDDDAELLVAEKAAFYAAESGLLAAEIKLKELKIAPHVGPWVAGSLEISQSRFSVEVLPGGHQDYIVLRSTGKTAGEGGRVITSVLEARAAKAAGKGWTVRSRKAL